jgi:hypothetical protein
VGQPCTQNYSLLELDAGWQSKANLKEALAEKKLER